MSPETASPVFPDRLIHPLPKRRLRERLTPEAAGTIKYPPSLTTPPPLFYYPFNLKDDASTTGDRTVVTGRANAASVASKVNETATATATVPAANIQSTISPAAAAVPNAQSSASQTIRLASHTRRPSAEPESPSAARVSRLANRTVRPVQVSRTTAVAYQPHLSTASSVDSYECFENTNNKKKRKIPTAGDTPLSGSYTLTDLHSATPVSSAANSIDESGVSSPLSTNYSATASFSSVSPGISGPGRGRYGRARSGRSPLHAITDANTNWAVRYGKLWSPWPMQSESDGVAPTPTQSSNGIISSAIAKAEKQVPHYQESDDQDYEEQLSALSTPASAQFTFTCSSQVPGNIMWPGSDPKMPAGSYIPRVRGGGLTSSGMAGTERGSSTSSSAIRRVQYDVKKKRSNKIRQEIKIQIRDRRRAQRERNAANSQMDDFYVCPFCDYEIITGRKSKLIFAFELKERKKRLEAERRQRERAKDRSRNKGRRGRKATVSNADANARQGTADEERQYEGAAADDPDAGELDDEAYDDDDDDDDGAGEADDVVPELRSGIGDAHVQRSRGRDGEGGRLRADTG